MICSYLIFLVVGIVAAYRISQTDWEGRIREAVEHRNAAQEKRDRMGIILSQRMKQVSTLKKKIASLRAHHADVLQRERREQVKLTQALDRQREWHADGLRKQHEHYRALLEQIILEDRASVQGVHDGMAAALADLLEPRRVEGCEKVRLHTEAEATAFARRVERDTGAPEGALGIYSCKDCPRNPVTNSRFLHIYNISFENRGKVWELPPAPALPTKMALRVTPAVMRNAYEKAVWKD